MHMNHKKTPAELETVIDQIDYTAVIARMTGQPLTEEQQASCAAYDALYDATHPCEKKTTDKT